MKLLVTGGTGKLGASAVRAARARGWTVAAPTREEMDVTDPAATGEGVVAAGADVVLHTAGYTAVDRAESDHESVFRVNRDGTRNVCEAAAATGARLVAVSTDYVFDGEADRPYLPGDRPSPLNVYGASKLAGEREALKGKGALVVRTSWLYGPDGPDFVDTVLRGAREENPLRVVSDQRGRPTWSESAAAALLDLAEADVTGVLHLADSGEASWHEFASEIVRAAGIATEVEPIATRDTERPARRPRYSVLDLRDTERVLGRELPPWRESLRRHLERIGAIESGNSRQERSRT